MDVDKADLQQVKRQHSELLVLQVVSSDLTAFAVEDKDVGPVPGLDGSSANFLKSMFLSGEKPFANFRRPEPRPKFPERWLLFRLMV